MTAPLSPRDESRALLLELLGVPRWPAEVLRQRAADADWQGLLDVTEAALLPMLSLRLEQRGLRPPAPVHRRLHGARQANAIAVMRRRAALRPAFAALDAAGISFTVLKGFALAHRVYPSPEARLMNDVDLWLGPAAVHRAAEVLGPLGWEIPWWRRRFREQPAEDDELGLILGDPPTLLELHSRPASLAETIPDSLELFRLSSVVADLGGIPARILPPDASLIHLSLHLAQHHRFLGALPRLLDLTLTVAGLERDFDWQGFAGRCVALGVEGWVATALSTAARMLGAPVPEQALVAFGVEGLDRLTRLASEQAWQPGKGAVGARSVLAEPTLAGRAGRLLRRTRNVLWPTESGGDGLASASRRLLRRVRFAAQVTLPGYLRNLQRGTFRGASGAELRRLTGENVELVAEMSRRRRRPASG